MLNVIHEDADLLVVNKPADLVCHPTKDGEMSSLIGRSRLYLGTEPAPRLINRLDRETSGIVVLAKTAGAARMLGKLWESRAVEKEYLAIVHGRVGEDRGIIDLPLGKDESSRVVVKDCVRTDGTRAQTRFVVERRFQRTPRGSSEDFSLLRLAPQTGRKHQIRIHLAHLGHPIVGDKLYGGDEDCYLALVERRLTVEQRERLIFKNHALHACAVRFEWKQQPVEFKCDPEPWFTEFLTE